MAGSVPQPERQASVLSEAVRIIEERGDSDLAGRVCAVLLEFRREQAALERERERAELERKAGRWLGKFAIESKAADAATDIETKARHWRAGAYAIERMFACRAKLQEG